ncbi:Gfo/Idh/MocA family protein [Caldicellulosiruptor bescii]|uniref:Oxidoreductase domain protein n=1 Tax=Caldicellulosiruptor bescii (strain ATCC BAA-1888 / DSM 6725 / KCTC 15123 / Z-1320) TaxID=521460 RepID=B9MLG9_CALBD|nr:Gfo/Idh/MocA family oxidoreductase [Caldicellulosiruptor bescii]ACM61159.1 oxidoreductase domain protein [Caldicellulosiruptor bescii DSM 6725]
MNIAKIGLIGISGFGSIHLRSIEQLQGKMVDLRAIVATSYEKNKEVIDRLASRGVEYYQDYRLMLENHKDLDFVAISTPIHLHAPMAIDAMERGFNVLLEKPPAVTIQDIDAIIETKRKTKRVCSVNFQNTSGKAFRKLLEYIREGRLGRIKSIIGVGRWKRDESYYQRNAWAGKLIVDGNYVLDGTINNPLAHLLNNELIIAETSEENGGVPQKVTAELYHGHKIEGEDTACVRIITKTGIEVYFYSTLCNREEESPYIIIEAEKARAYWTFANKFKIEYFDGNTEEFDGGREDLFVNMYINMVEHLFEGKQLYCPLEVTRNFVLASNGAFESSGCIYDIPDEYLEISNENGKIYTYIKNIKEIIDEAAENRKLFSEIGVPWAKQTEEFDLIDYCCFSMFKR